MHSIHKVFSGFLVVVLALAASVSAQTQAWDTLLVVPARYSVLQIAFDCAHQFKTVLVSYQGGGMDGNPLLLHAWNGQSWVYVDTDDYADASFIKTPPGRVILVGDDSVLPEELVERSGWCGNVLSIPTLQSAALLNALGRHLNFSDYQWKWFSKRYGLELEDLNTERRRTSWYDGKYDFEEMDRLRAEERKGAHIPPAPVLDVQPAAVEIMPEAIVPVQPVNMAPAPEPESAPDLKAAIDRIEARMEAEEQGGSIEAPVAPEEEVDIVIEVEQPEVQIPETEPELETPVAPKPVSPLLKPSAPAPALSLPPVAPAADALMMPEE